MIKKFLPWLIGLLYFISPYDVLPDFVLGPGWLDDLAVLGLIYWWVSRFSKGAHGTANSSSGGAGTRREEPHSQEAEDDPYKILGVQPGASQEEIKVAYKRLVARYHPDKVQHLGEDFQKLAHEKFVAIQKAYNELTQK